MWGPLCLLWMLIWITTGAPQISRICPQNCECSTLKEGLKAHCSSIDFLTKLKPKQIIEITELDISSASLTTIDAKLKKLRNLKKLNLSRNDIKKMDKFPHLPGLTHLYLSHNYIVNFTAFDLPKSLTNLDVSFNRITNLTNVAKFLPNLVELNLNDNLLACECDFLKYRDLLLLKGVHIVRPSRCHSPTNVRGISLFSVYCASGTVVYDDWEHMLRDEPGSGEDTSAIVAASTSLDVVDFDKTDEDDENIEEEYFRTNIDSSSSSPESDEDSFEGSGSSIFDIRGSGDGDIVPVSPDPNISHCFYNCSTPAPEDDNKSGPAASIGKEMTILFNELTGKKDEATTTTTSEPVTEEVVKPKSISATFSKSVPKEASSENKEQELEKIRAIAEPPTDLQNTKITENTAEKDNTTTYIVVGVLFAAMIALVAYVIVKKRNKSNNNRRPESNYDVKEPPPVEMKPLMLEDKIPKPAIVPEMTPLMNGQNGTKKSEAEDPVGDVTDGKPPVENGIDIPDDEEPQIRPKKDDEPLVAPGTKRVTIQAKELSSPKSPVLVHRHVGDDGQIVITPPVSNSEKYT